MQLHPHHILYLSLLLSPGAALSPKKGPRVNFATKASSRPSRVPFLVSPPNNDQDSNIDTFITRDWQMPDLDPTLTDNVIIHAESSEQEEYRRKLIEARSAIAAAGEARRKLQRSHPRFRPSRVKISRTDAGTLVIELPPSGLNAESIFSGAFSVAWFSVVLPATFSGLWLFMLPFWAAGALVTKQAVVDPFLTSELSIGQYAWSAKTIYGSSKGIKLNGNEGASEDLLSAQPELVAVVNDVPQYEIKLYTSKGETSLPMGSHVSEEELEYLVEEINNQIQEIQAMPRTKGLLP